MFCKKCGNQLNDSAAFCTKCGTPTSKDTNMRPVNANVQTGNNVSVKENAKKKPNFVLICASVLLVCIVVLIFLIVVLKKGNDSTNVVLGEDNTKVEDATGGKGLPKEGQALFEQMMGDWDASLTGGFFGADYYTPHWKLFIDEDFIYVTDGHVFSHDVNDIEYVEENGVGYIVFEDEIFHRKTLSSVDVRETIDLMEIRLYFSEDGQKLIFDIKPQGDEWKNIAEYERAGSTASTENVEMSDSDYIETGKAMMEVAMMFVLQVYGSLEDFDAVIEAQYGGDATAALFDTFMAAGSSSEDDARVLCNIIGKHYVEAISYYEENGSFNDDTMIELGIDTCSMGEAY
uniref:zinc-ribbon domain-containing protein n=1 Tax=Acetatifactor sp. TaxID=1872090 RepID=UPI00405663DD